MIGAQLGVWDGSLSRDLFRLDETLTLVMADSWCGGYNPRNPYESVRQKEMDCAAVLAEAVTDKYRFRRVIVRADLITSACLLSSMFDFVAIVGCHSCNYVYNEATAWWTTLVPGGLMFVDNYGLSEEWARDVKAGLDKFMSDAEDIDEVRAEDTARDGRVAIIQKRKDSR